ncbi:MAG: diguanylate cyclase [Gammaproteobacteria bacterium]|nr:diguanylate cyclase [Gammaproteobacteria bacterium]MBU1555347.1 diguanylate cyclase [Gammaproteobacteria bacterium]MBU2069871.1 diguanylate cyclase [Gammaproteobacteria bacterium]MBU2184847.1 diguanylate cyclase [Gammaproteobacteria bacterium]MBU2204383.1 diguanylate cyclase [Gammaproteobacteria bacterium]
MTVKPPHLHREANLIQMLDPMSTDWNQALPAPNTTVTSKLVAALDFSRLNSLFENFLQVMDVPIALIDLQGKVLASSRWQRACIQFHRQAETTLQRCLESDRDLALQLEQGKNYSIYRCRNGLTDCATPIVLDGEHIANLFIGQFLLHEPDQAYFTAQAKQAGFDKNDYLAALAEVPIVDESRLPAMLNMLASLALQITELSLANLRYQHSLQLTEQQVQQRTQELTLQNQILSQISEGAALKTVLHNLVTQVELLHPDMLCSILLLDEDGKTLRHGAAPSLPDAYNQAIDGVVIGEGVGSCGSAAYSGKTVIVTDISSHPYWQPYLALAELAAVKACWSQPVKNAQGKVLGTFAIYQRQPAEPSAELLEKIKTYSNLAELAISRSLSSSQIRRLAFYDSLTGLANRRLLEEHLLQAMAASKRSQKFCGLMFIDLDNFKPVNDLYGHKVGDALLEEVARRLQSAVRQADTVARFGGDEFIVLLRDIDADDRRSKQHMQVVATKIAQELSRPYPLNDNSMHQCACSIGLVLFLGDADSDELLRQADMAMYQAKKLGQNRPCWYNKA